MGYYDMANPYYAVEYTLNHISIDSMLLKNFSRSYYEAGHMIDEKSLTKLHSDVNKFIPDSMTR
jgi:carboxypeptidase C (cathepsin A)